MTHVSLPEPALPPGADPEALYDIVNGNRVEFSKSVYALWVAGQLHRPLWQFVQARQLARTFMGAHFVLDAEIDQRRRIDLAFVGIDRWPLERRLPETGDWIMVPNLAVEVLSPGDAFEQILAKLQEYFHYGVQQFWLVSPKVRKVYVYDSPTRVRIVTDVDALDNTVVPFFTLRVREIFQKAM